jgi:hypothetical protein
MNRFAQLLGPSSEMLVSCPDATTTARIVGLKINAMKRLPLALLLVLFATCWQQIGYATDITVTTTVDEVNGDTTSITSLLNTPGGAGISLREAVIAVNNTATGTPHRIVLPAGTYQLTIDGTGEDYPALPAVGDLDITRSGTTIEGATAATTIIQQTRPNDRVIEVNPGLVGSFVFTNKQVTIRGGRETTGIGGGGIVSGSTGNLVVITDCIFTDNQVSSAGGGAIGHAGGDLIVNNCTFTSNIAQGSGGAILFDAGTTAGPGTLTVAGCQFSSNTAMGSGGAIETAGTSGVYAISRSTFTGNQAQGVNARGGAVFNQTGTMSVTSCTLQNNQVTHTSGAGGAIGSDSGNGQNVTVSYCRLLGNSAATPANGLTLYAGGSGVMTANDNWWGVNSGPAANHVVSATASFWLQLTHTANPATITSGVGGSTTLTASFLTNSGSATISAANLSALVGVAITFGSQLNGSLSSVQSTIQSSGTATAIFTATAPATGSAIATVDSQQVTATVPIAPSVSSVSVPANGLYGIGDVLDFTVHFNESIVVTSGTPYLPITLDTGGTVQAGYVSGSGTANLVFRYTVATGNVDPNGIAVGSAINANGASLRDSESMNAILTLNSVASTAGVLVDGIAPTINISGPSPTVTVGGVVDYTVTYADANFNSSTLAIGDITLTPTSTAGGIVSVLGTGLTRTVRISGISGHGTLVISIAAGTATDTAGNAAPAAGPSTAVTVYLPPTITGTVASQAVNDNATIAPFSGVTIAFADLPAQSLTTTVSLDLAAKGAFTPASLTASGFTAAGPGTYVFNGTAAAATTAIRLLSFAPTSNRVPRGSTETTSFTISVTDGVFTPVANTTTTVITTSVNHQPTAVSDTIERFAKSSVKVSVATLLANDTDPDSDTLSITGVSSTSPNSASIYLSGTWVHYVPAAGFTGADTFTYTVSDGHSGTAVGTVTVNIKTDDSTALNQIGTIENLGPSGYRVTFGGIPGRTYTIQYTDNISHPITWHTLGTAAATATGTITFDDNPGAPLRFYRSVYP